MGALSLAFSDGLTAKAAELIKKADAKSDKIKILNWMMPPYLRVKLQYLYHMIIYLPD